MLVPRENWRDDLRASGAEIVPIDSLEQALRLCLLPAAGAVESGERPAIGDGTALQLRGNAVV